jgi:hypothetical protein
VEYNISTEKKADFLERFGMFLHRRLEKLLFRGEVDKSKLYKRTKKDL